MPPPPPQSDCLDAAVGVSTRPKKQRRGRLWHCTLGSLFGLSHRDQLDFGSFLRLIAARICHHTACSLNDVHSHSSASFSDNASVTQGMIDFHTNSLFPFISYHFSYMSLLSLGYKGSHYLSDWLGCSGQLKDRDPESTVN